MRITEFKEVVLDTGILVEILEGKLKSLLDDILNQKKIAYVSRITITECSYVICRKFGTKESELIVNEFMDSNIVTVIDSIEIY
ncbi:MAG: PIN domain-containing protein [Thermoplasmataceae archaeon]